MMIKVLSNTIPESGSVPRKTTTTTNHTGKQKPNKPGYDTSSLVFTWYARLPNHVPLYHTDLKEERKEKKTTSTLTTTKNGMKPTQWYLIISADKNIISSKLHEEKTIGKKKLRVCDKFHSKCLYFSAGCKY